MALYGAFSKEKHLEELADNLPTDEGNLTPAVRRLRTLQNLLGNTSITLADVTKLADIDATATELDLLDGSSAANSNASVAAILDANKRFATTGSVGTAGTNVTAAEYGDALNHITILTLSSVAATIGDTASLAGGALIYTLPAGACVVRGATMSVGMTLTTGTPTTDTPEFGLGTTIGSGANATLGAVGAAAENILGPAVANNVAGTAELLTGSPNLVIEAAGDHTVHFNYADAWANVTNTAATLSGTVVLEWTLLPLS